MTKREVLKSAVGGAFFWSVPLLLAGLFIWGRFEHPEPPPADLKDELASKQQLLKLLVEDPLFKEIGAGEITRDLIRSIDLKTLLSKTGQTSSADC